MAKSVWEEFKDLFKTKEQKEQEKRDMVTEALEREKEVAQKLEELDKQYRDSLPEEEEPDLEELFPSDSGLRELEYEAESDEQIEERAKKQSEEKKEADKKKLQNEFDKEANAVDAKKKAAEEALGEKNADIEARYAVKSEEAKDNALENGVVRGSILSSVLSELTENKGGEQAQAAREYETKISALDDKLATLEREMEAALEQLDMKYAAQLTKDIADLKKQRDEEVKKYEKYNQNIRKQQAEYAYDREQDINKYLADLAEKKQADMLAQQKQEEKYGYSGEKQKNYSQRYDLAYEFYMSLDPSIALEAFDASPNMKYYLGLYYDKLRNEIKNHSTAQGKYYF